MGGEGWRLRVIEDAKFSGEFLRGNSGSGFFSAPIYLFIYLSIYFFFPVSLEEMESERRSELGGKERKIILFWNLDSGAHRPRSQSIWPV